MAKRTIGAIADLIEDRVDKDRADTTFDQFVIDMLNLTLQEMSAEVPHSRWLMDETTLTATVSGTQYIVMPTDLDIDSLISMRDPTNSNRKIVRIDAQDSDLIDPGRDLTGDEIFWWYQRVETTGTTFEDRIYFLNRPDSADTLTAIFGILVPTGLTGTSTAVLPEKYEPILMEGTLVKVWERLDPENTNMITLHKSAFERGLLLIEKDADSTPGASSNLAYHRPFRSGLSVTGAAFPANYDVR